MNSEQLIKNIEILSVNKGVNKTNALVECGAGKNFISNLLKGSEPSIAKIEQIADYFGVTIDYLLGRAETHEISNSAQTTKEQQLIKAYKQHPELQPAIDKLLGVEELGNGDKLIFRAARSADNHPAEITVLTKEEQERIEKAPKVTSENSDL